jgi:hypothetical protein
VAILGADNHPVIPGHSQGQPPPVGGSAWIQPSGLGADPWVGVQNPSPTLVRPQIKPQSTLNLAGISAARGVIGEIRKQAQLNNVPVALALAVAKQESGFRQEAVSSAGAVGIMQLMPATAFGMGVDPEDWKQNIAGGVRYLAGKYQALGNWKLALAAYNGGYTNAKSGAWKGVPETRNYVQSVSSIARSISNGTFKPTGGSSGLLAVSPPLPGNPTVISGFGPRGTGAQGDFHNGVDLAAPLGTAVHAIAGGEVVTNGYEPKGAGNYVVVRDKQGREWHYMHLASRSGLDVGSKVVAGGQLGAVGATGAASGPHVQIGLNKPELGVALKMPAGKAAISLASKQIGQPYVWGGESRKEGGFDCSGLVQWTYKQLGINLPRTAAEQFRVGKPVSKANLQPGDLVFLEPGSSGPGHVVIYAGKGNVIAAPHTGTDVQVQKLSYVLGDGWVGAKRIIGTPHAKKQTWVNPMNFIRTSYKAGFGKTTQMRVSMLDMLPPSAGGTNGSGMPANPGGGLEQGTYDLGVPVPQSVDAAVTPGGGTAIPSNADQWQQVINSGASSPETKNLAQDAGAVVDNSPPLAALYNNSGITG